MTTDQKNSYLEAHMEVQQHMQQVSLQLNKHTHNQGLQRLDNSNLISQQLLNGPHQSASNLNLSNQYSSANPIKVWHFFLFFFNATIIYQEN